MSTRFGRVAEFQASPAPPLPKTCTCHGREPAREHRGKTLSRTAPRSKHAPARAAIATVEPCPCGMRQAAPCCIQGTRGLFRRDEKSTDPHHWRVAGSEADGRGRRARHTTAVRGTDAHKTDGLAELVCSNSFPLRRRSMRSGSYGQMRLAGSLMARGCATPTRCGWWGAGGRPRRRPLSRQGSRPTCATTIAPRGSCWASAWTRRLLPLARRMSLAEAIRGETPMRWLSSMRLRRSCISTRSTWIFLLVPVALRQGRARRRQGLCQLPASTVKPCCRRWPTARNEFKQWRA